MAENRAYEVGDVPPTVFVGFEQLDSPGTILALRDGDQAVASYGRGKRG